MSPLPVLPRTVLTAQINIGDISDSNEDPLSRSTRRRLRQKGITTGITAVYLGPAISFTWKENLSVEAGVDVPVVQDNTALQLVPGYRVRAAVTWRF